MILFIIIIVLSIVYLLLLNDKFSSLILEMIASSKKDVLSLVGITPTTTKPASAKTS